MCGIAGYLGESHSALLDHMLASLTHRGPDEVGHHHEHGVTFGVRRLRVIDPVGGHQPIANETGSVRVVLNGEIYNYRELREELLQKGHTFRSRCDTEVLVHLYEEEGEASVHRLRGMFAFALWDRDRQTLLLVRDRFGMKPLYLSVKVPGSESEPLVAFSSELPSLLVARPGRTVDLRALADYFTLLYVPGPRTVYQGITQVRPGELLRIRQGRVESWQYFRPDQAVPLTDGAVQPGAVEHFHEVLQETVRQHMVSDVPLGLFLSGGLDSGAILAMMRQVTNGPIRTFSIGYGAEADRSYNELDAARLLANHFGTQHHAEMLRPDGLQLLPRIAAVMGEPFADASAIPTYLVSQVARQSVTVALSGIGGDELFGGYPRHLGLLAASQYASIPPSVRAWVARQIAPRLSEGAGSRNRLGRLKRFLRDGHAPLGNQYLQWTTFLPSEWGASAFTPDFLEEAGSCTATEKFLDLYQAWPSRNPTDRAMGLDLQTYLPDDLLRMADRLSMAHSLELRTPFCDHDLLAFAQSIPAAVRFSGWRLKGFMRQALRNTLPAKILARPKTGFQVPLARWLREDLRDMVHDLLSDRAVRRRGYVKPEYVRWLLQEHESGRRNFCDQLYALVMLELWMEQQKSTATALQPSGESVLS